MYCLEKHGKCCPLGPAAPCFFLALELFKDNIHHATPSAFPKNVTFLYGKTQVWATLGPRIGWLQRPRSLELWSGASLGHCTMGYGKLLNQNGPSSNRCYYCLIILS